MPRPSPAVGTCRSSSVSGSCSTATTSWGWTPSDCPRHPHRWPPLWCHWSQTASHSQWHSSQTHSHPPGSWGTTGRRRGLGWWWWQCHWCTPPDGCTGRHCGGCRHNWRSQTAGSVQSSPLDSCSDEGEEWGSPAGIAGVREAVHALRWMILVLDTPTRECVRSEGVVNGNSDPRVWLEGGQLEFKGQVSSIVISHVLSIHPLGSRQNEKGRKEGRCGTWLPLLSNHSHSPPWCSSGHSQSEASSWWCSHWVQMEVESPSSRTTPTPHSPAGLPLESGHWNWMVQPLGGQGHSGMRGRRGERIDTQLEKVNRCGWCCDGCAVDNWWEQCVRTIEACNMVVVVSDAGSCRHARV